MRVVEIATDEKDIARVLAEQSLAPRPPPRHLPVPRGQLSLPLA